MRSIWRIAIVLGLLSLVVALIQLGSGVDVEENSLLVIELGGEYIEGPEPPLLARLFGEPPSPFARPRSLFAKAERDERIQRVVIEIHELGIGWGKAQELREMVQRLREAGRHPVAYLEVERFGSSIEYFVASAAEEVYVAPATRSPFVGMAAEFLFLGGFWEKLGIEIEAERIGDFKSAAETLTGKSMSDAHREMANALLDSIEGQFVAGIAESRGLSPDLVRKSSNEGLVTFQAMQDHGLIDGVLYLDELLGKYKDQPVIDGKEYAFIDPEDVGWEPEATFALIYGAGNVVTGEDSGSISGGPVLAADTVVAAIEAAVEDSDISAIVLRIDSPGGSPLASDLVWRAVQKARQAGKPVIASFSDVAASGGYYVACGADKIVVQPGTLTGSIGVFVLRPVISGLLDKLDIGYESLMRGEHSDMLLSTQTLSPESRRKLKEDVASVYSLFLDRVSVGRSLDKARVDALGQGRVWTGEQAVGNGLADAIGGLRVAALEAKKLAGLDLDTDVALVVYPPPEPLAVQISRALGGAHLASRARVMPLPPLLEKFGSFVEDFPTGSPVLMPPYLIEIR